MLPSLRRLQATPAYTQLLALIKGDLKKAMIAKNNLEKNTIRLVLSTVKNSEIDGAKQTEFELARSLNKMIKQRIDSSHAFKTQGRDDLASAEEEEADIIRKYVIALPVASEEEILKKVKVLLEELKQKDGSTKIGSVFKEITEEVATNWGSSSAVIKAMVPGLYKEVFGQKK